MPIDSDNGLSLVRHQATVWINAGMLLIWHTFQHEIRINIHCIMIGEVYRAFVRFHKKMHGWAMLAATCHVSHPSGILSVLMPGFASVFNDLLLGNTQQRCAWRHLNCTWEFHNHRRECVRLGNRQTKHDHMVSSSAAKVFFDSDGNEKLGRLKSTFSIFRW